MTGVPAGSPDEAAPTATGNAYPLSGCTIVVTRSRTQASSLTAKLKALGARVLEIPTIALEPPPSWEPLDAALRSLATYDWLIVTSANTARVLGERLACLGLTVEHQPQTVVIGPATARALAEAGLRVDLVPQPATAESVVAALGKKVRGQRVLLARAAVARDLIPTALTQAGAQVTVVEAYRTVLAQQSQVLLLAAFGSSEEKVDALTFTSSSTVTNLATLLDAAGLPWPAQARVFSIGPITSETLRAHGVTPDGEAAHHDVDGLVEAVVRGLAADEKA